MVPLLIFAFNRPDRLRQVITAIAAQTRKPDYIISFLDGPRHNSDGQLVRACKNILTGIADEVIERDRNFGCALNIMLGTNDVANRYGGFVVLEDDTVPARAWYETMLLLLNRYANDRKVGAVGSFPSVLNGSLTTYDYDVIMSPRFSCWGWGSWSDKWLAVCSDWIYYWQNGKPKWPTATLPNHGGDDIAAMIDAYPAGQLWDGVVAGYFLHHGLLQAIPRYYLVRNIGADIHLAPAKLKFMFDNNPIEDRLPLSFPPASVLDDKVSSAVRAYVAAMSS